jgi:hypothetical protein
LDEWRADRKDWEAFVEVLRDWDRSVIAEAIALDEMVNRR